MNDFKPVDRRPTQDLIYIVDEHFDVVRTNDAWRQFAVENHGMSLLERGKRINVLESMHHQHRKRWKALYNLLRRGQFSEYHETFSCPSPGLQRQYELTVQPLYSPSGEVDYLEHRTRLLYAEPVSNRSWASASAANTPKPDTSAETHPIELSAFCRPLAGNGGDLVWSDHETDTRAWLLIADAMGHDAPAARASQHLRDLIADNLSDTPKTVIETVNRKFRDAYRCEGTGMFVTGLLLLIDLDLQQVRVCNFGHHGLLTARSGLVKVEAGMPVGMLSDAGPWPEETLDTETIGERGMVFTDGMVEQFNSEGKMYTVDRLAKAFSDSMELPLFESLHAILQSVDEFRDGAAQKDDQTLLGFELLTYPLNSVAKAP